MAYGDDWEREFIERTHRWSQARWEQEQHERCLSPDDRLDEVGWDIFYCAITRGMDMGRAAQLAMDGNYRLRRLVRDDMFERHTIDLKRRWVELHPGGADYGVWETHAPDQIKFWESRLTSADYVYFIQSGPDGPIKIGQSIKPRRRLPQLQTGNPDELILRHVIPGDLAVEQRLHERFEPARIRGEWFGREYLPIILAFAGGLATRVMHAYDGSGLPPELNGGDVRTAAETERIRRDIERLWRAGHDIDAIAEYSWLETCEVEQHLAEMRKSKVWDVQTPGGYYERGGKTLPFGPRPRARRPRRSSASPGT